TSAPSPIRAGVVAPLFARGSCARWAAALSAVAATEAPIAALHEIGPRGRQPKKWLTPGVCISKARSPADATLVSTTGRLKSPEVSVWPSCVPTSAARPIVRALGRDDTIRPMVHA